MKALPSDPLPPRERDPGRRRREWRLERLGWLVMALVVAAGLLGAFGGGLLSRGEARGPDGLVLEYARLARMEAPEELRLLLPAPVSPATLRISSAFLLRARLVEVDPPPLEVRVRADERELLFGVERRGAPIGAFPVVLRVQYAAIGTARGWVAADGGARVPFAVFVYP